ncbi:hypothetical protein BDZ89DRAFT_593171 [Hymenopellis radicata]|nr:hypothetical protein BDZ89DRAFT_593171 [Hymenopellis radicata]
MALRRPPPGSAWADSRHHWLIEKVYCTATVIPCFLTVMNRPDCLCPGYTQVDTFGPDDDYDDEEEVVYVTLDLTDVDASLIPSSKAYRLMGLDTPNPFMQLSGTILKGAYCSVMGSELIFVEDAKSAKGHSRGDEDTMGLDMDVKAEDNASGRKDAIRYLTSCEQRVSFSDVRLYRKDDASAGQSDPEPVVPSAIIKRH